MASVFHRTGVAVAPAVKTPTQLRGPRHLRAKTTHFAVYVDPALGTDGQKDADVVLASCEADYARISGYFGGLSAGAFSVILFSSPNGAFHMTCAATDLFCDATTGPANGNYSEFLNIAEFVEVFEAVQKQGWNCGKSHGDGLARVLGNDFYAAALDGFGALDTTLW